MATLKEWEASLESKRTKQNLKYLKESKLVFDPIRHNATDKSDTTVVYAETGKEDPSKNGMFTYSPATLIIGEISVQKEKYKPRADKSFFQWSLFENLSKEFEVTKYGDYGNSLMSDFVFGIYNSPNFTYDKVEYFEYNKHAFIIWTQNNPTATSDCKENYVCANLYDGMASGYVCAVAGDNGYVQLYDDHKDNVNRLVAYMLYGSTTKWRDVYPKATTRKFVGGFKPICMPVAPNEEGKQYAAQGDQWVEVKAGGGSEEGALCVKFTINGAPTVKDKRTTLHATANYSKKEILDAFKNNRVVYTDDSTSDVLGTKLILTVNSTGSDYYFSAVDVLKLSDEDEKFNTLVFAPVGSNEDSKDFDIYINSDPFGDFVKDVEDDSGTVYGRKNGEWVEIETGGSGEGAFVIEIVDQDEEGGDIIVTFDKTYKEIKDAIAKGLPLYFVDVAEKPNVIIPITTSFENGNLHFAFNDGYYSKFSRGFVGGATTFHPLTYEDTETKYEMCMTSLLPEAPADGNQYARMDGKWVKIEAGGGSGDCNVVVLDTEEKSAEAEASMDLNKIYLDRLSKQPRLCCYRNEYIKIGYAYLDNEKKWTILTTKTPTVGTDAEEAYNQLNVHEDYSSKLVTTAIKGEYASGDKWFHSDSASHTKAAERHGMILIMSKLIRGSDDHEVVVFIDYYDYEMQWGVCNYGETFNSVEYGNFTLGEDWDSSVELFEKKIIGCTGSHEVFISTYNSGIRELAMPAAPSNGYYIAAGGGWESFEKAPWDGKQYGMKNGKWTEIEAGGSGEGAFVIEIVDQSVEKGRSIFTFNRNLKEIKAAITKGLSVSIVVIADSLPVKFNLNAADDGADFVLFCSDAHYSKEAKGTDGGAVAFYPKSNDDDETKFEAYTSSFIEDVPADGNQYVRKNGEWVDIEAGGGSSKGVFVIEIDVATQALSSDDLEKVNDKYPYVQLYDSNADKMYRFNMAYLAADLKNKFYIFDRHTFTFDQAKMEIADEGREYLIINGDNGEITKKTIK